MALLNYTTTVPVMRTVSQIHHLLVEAGARSIQTDWGDGHPVSLVFEMETALGPRSFRLPSGQVKAVLQRQKVQARFCTLDHAERVAWRIVKDWLEAQLAIIRAEMVTIDQIMLPYMQGDDGRTVYELYRDQQLALEERTNA